MDNKQIKISVIVPVYNVENYIHRCIDSILNQTYSNLEIILVDDGSTDSSGKICDEYKQVDNRITVIHKQNGGQGSARNVGLEIANGDYISFIDSDDYIDPDMYEIMLKVAITEKADVVECGYRWIKPEGTRDIDNTNTIDIYDNLEALEALYFGNQISGGVSIVVWNKLYSMELLKEIRFTEGFAEDIEFTPRVYYYMKRLAKYNYNYYNFYFSPNSSSRSQYKMINTTRINMQRKVIDFFRSVGLKKYEQYAYALYTNNLYNDYYECYKRRDDREFRFIAKERKKELKCEYNNILKNPYLHSKWKTKLFRFSPLLWYYVAKLYKYIKSISTK